MSVEKYRKSGASAKPNIFAATYEAVGEGVTAAASLAEGVGLEDG